MGGLFGLVGLGRVRAGFHTRPFLAPAPVGRSALSLAERMDDCETPVEGARSIREAAEGVAVCERAGLTTVCNSFPVSKKAFSSS